MIPAKGRYKAIFEQSEGEADPGARNVEAWSDDGLALIVDHQTGRLVPASTCRNFLHIEENNEDVFIGVIPAGGWRLTRINDGQESPPMPVLGWVVDESGWATPLAPDSANGLGMPTHSEEIRLLPPPETSTQ